MPVNGCTFVCVVGYLDRDLVTPIGLDQRTLFNVSDGVLGGLLRHKLTWYLPIDQQARRVYAVRSAVLLGERPVIVSSNAGVRV